MNLKEQFEKETGIGWTKLDADGMVQTNDYYVEWLEQRLKASQKTPIVMWRVLKKEKPGDGEQVLIAIDDKVDYGTIKDYEVATFDGRRFFDSYGDFVNNVTHWKRIEPPQDT